MANITLKGSAVHTSGNLPAKGSKAPDFTLVKSDLSEVTLSNYAGKKLVLNVFPSIDTGTCAMSVRKFNQQASDLNNAAVINVSVDLPFAQARFCGAEGIKNAETASAFRSNFATDYGLKMTDGPLAGLCSRAVIVLDEQGKVLYTEQVPDIVDEPNYGAAIQALK